MSIKFLCESCHKTVEAPDSAAGKRGKCPYCGHSCYIAKPVEDEELIPLSPEAEAEGGPANEEAQQIKAMERELLHEMGREPAVPLEEKEDLTSEDLHHLVVNYCMDMFAGNLDRAETTARDMKKFKYTAIQAVEDFESGKAAEQALKAIPAKVFQGFLGELKKRIQQ